MTETTVHQRRCKFQGCEKKHYAHGMCNTHYARVYRGKGLLNYRETFVAENPPKDGIALIPLNHGKHAIVDAKWYEYLMQWKWRYTSFGYAVRNSEDNECVFMHRVVNRTSDDKITDHINRNRLDNREANLRSCSHAENNRNRAPKRNTTSRFKGVCWSSKEKRWLAQISIKNIVHRIGSFKSEKEAAIHYDVAAQIISGAFAVINNV